MLQAQNQQHQVDAMGAQKMKKRLRDLMTDAGVKVTRYHPIRLIDLGQVNKRTHRKVAVFDGKVGYICGHGISRLWLGNGEDKEHWRDTGVRLCGPKGLANLASAFGYTNASWTLRCELTSQYVCRLLRYMDRHGYGSCTPREPIPCTPLPCPTSTCSGSRARRFFGGVRRRNGWTPSSSPGATK